MGYSAADVRPILLDTWNYLQCSTSGDTADQSRIDLFALNSYSWCGGDTFQTSGYDVLTSYFAHTSLPVFFSEYGCNRVLPRPFDEVQALYAPPMSQSLSGGVIYEYSQEDNKYGLVAINSDSSAKLLIDFDNLQGQYNKLNFTAIEGLKSTNSSVTPPVCTSSLITSAGFSNNFTVPPPPPGAQALIENGFSNANIGNLVSITNLKVSQVVRGSDGAVINDLAIKPIPDDQSNVPSATNPSVTTSAAPSATMKKSAAVKIERPHTGALFLGSLVAALCL